MTALFQLLVDGIITGSVFALAAVGVSLLYGGLRIINFAQGDMMTFGAFVAVGFTQGLGLPFPLGVIAGVLATAVLSVVLEYTLFRPLRRRGAGMLGMFVTAIGLALVLRQGILFAAGASYRSYPVDSFSVVRFAGIRVATDELYAGVVALAVIVVLAVGLARTSLGKSVRALSDNPSLTSVSGIDPDRVATIIWVSAGALAGLAGTLQGLVQTSFDSNMGWNQLLPVFCAVVLGGIGSAYGALFGGLVLGIVMQASTWSGFAGGVPASYQLVVAFVALIAVLLVRPQGLLGRSRIL